MIDCTSLAAWTNDGIIDREHPRQCTPEMVAQVAGWRAIFDLEDGLVVAIEHHLVGKADFTSHRLGVRIEARTGDVAKEIRFALGTRCVQRGRLGPQPPKGLAEGFAQRYFELGKASALELSQAGASEIRRAAR